MVNPVFDYEAGLAACAADDPSALLALYRHEAPAMYALTCSMLGDAAAAVVLHETFVLIWHNADGYSPALGTARAWIYSILRYRAHRHLHSETTSGAPAGASAPLPRLEARAGSSPITRTIVTLPPAQREALLHVYLHGGSLAQVAGRLNRSEPDVRASLEAALGRIDAAVHA